MSNRRRAGAGAVALLAVTTAFAVDRAQAQVPPARSPCQVSGSVKVWPKMACPFDVMDVALAVRVYCPGGVEAPELRWLRVQHTLPRALQAVPSPGDGATAEFAVDRTYLAPPNQIYLTHRVQPSSPGLRTLGGARVTVEDDQGRVSTALLEPAILIVSPWCRRNPSLYLPLMHRPICVPQSEPADVALVVDRSSSVGGAGLAAATDHVHMFLDTLDFSRDRVALVAFDQHAVVVAPLGSPQIDIQRAMKALQPAPGTRIERAIRVGAGELTGPRARPDRRRLLVLITDGVQIGPGDDSVVLEAAAQVRDQGVAILSLALGPRPNRGLLEAIGGTSDHTVPASSAAEVAEAWLALASVAGCAK